MLQERIMSTPHSRVAAGAPLEDKTIQPIPADERHGKARTFSPSGSVPTS
jgi:hypothetical protein